MTPRSRGRNPPGVVHVGFALGHQRAWGMPGAQCTRSLACKMIVSTRASHHRSTRFIPASPHANGFNGLLRALPGDRLVVTVGLRIKVLRQTRSGLTKPPQDLTPAPGRQDHTTSPSASNVSRLCAPFDAHEVHLALHRPCAPDAAASTASCPNVRDDRETPLCGTGWRELWI